MSDRVIFKNCSVIEVIEPESEVKRSSRYEKWLEYYERYPDVFVEEFFDVKLLPYQKFLLKYFNRKKEGDKTNGNDK